MHPNLCIQTLYGSMRIFLLVMKVRDFALQNLYTNPQLFNQRIFRIESCCVHVHRLSSGVVVH